MLDKDFEQLVSQALDSLPQEFIDRLGNVLITIEDNPTPEQIKILQLRPWTRLLGLYQGTSLLGRAIVTAPLLPDKITIFKFPIFSLSQNPDEIKENVRTVVFHEIAHHFGFSEIQIREIEARNRG